MNWLSMMSDADKKIVVAQMTQYLACDPVFDSIIQRAVTSVFERHGFRPGHSDTAALHNIGAQSAARGTDAARLTALAVLIAEAKKAANYYYAGLSTDQKSIMEARSAMLHAILAVEREWKEVFGK
jgi:hypothetical protein